MTRIITVLGLVVLVTMTISFGSITSYSQQDNSKNQYTNGLEYLKKYPVADYDAPEPPNAAERKERKEKNKRYDKKSFVIVNPRPEFIMSTIYDAEPVPSAIPFSQSKLVIVGEILNAKALMSNDKSGVYSEYAVQIQTVLKEDKERKLHLGQSIFVDRMGGGVRYSNGQTIHYLNSWQDLPESAGRYLLFLKNDDGKNPNYRIITAYRLKNDKVSALDYPRDFRKFDEMNESDFIKLVLSRNYP
jgi:hypothetical protein